MGAMPDDFRLTVDFDDEADGAQLVERLDARRFEHEERRRFGDRVVVSRDAGRVFLYTDAESDAHAVEEVIRDDLAKAGRTARVALERWHPEAEEWRDISVPLPQTEAEHEAEEDLRLAREEAEALRTGRADWEVRVELPGHDETVALAERLESEGIPVVRRYTYLLVGAVNEEAAGELAKRLESEAPAGAKVHVQPGGELVWEVTPQNPFVLIGGGLGG
jgi:hypothetical protein